MLATLRMLLHCTVTSASVCSCDRQVDDVPLGQRHEFMLVFRDISNPSSPATFIFPHPMVSSLCRGAAGWEWIPANKGCKTGETALTPSPHSLIETEKCWTAMYPTVGKGQIADA